jgi:hypothetical protein
MREVFLDELPHRGKMIDWKNSVGYDVRFIYDDIKGNITIFDYLKEKSLLIILYKNKKYKIFTCSFANCKLGKILTNDFYSIEKDNNISITHPHLLKYFVDKNDAYNNTFGSNKKVLFKCPNCGKEKTLSINYVTNHDTISCGCSSDGISYPEKFVFNLLLQLNTNFQKQLNKLNVNWINSGIRYDFAILDKNIIIETHGIQHYKDKFSKLTGISIQEQKIIDYNKEQLAKENGIEHYIVLDCRKSELEWIKKSVMDSELPTILNFKEEDIDWLKCHEYALNNFVKEVCEYKLTHQNMGSSQIGEIFNLNASTIINYLKKGNELGWCTYDVNIERKNQNIRLVEINKIRCNKRVEIFKDGKTLGVFESIKDLANQSLDLFNIQLNAPSISRACNGILKTHHGFTFSFV